MIFDDQIGLDGRMDLLHVCHLYTGVIFTSVVVFIERKVREFSSGWDGWEIE